MINKLVRFEARSTFRLLVIVWAAILALAIIISVVGMITGVSSYQDILSGSTAMYVIDKIISTVMWILYVTLFVAQIVLTVAIVVLRFYRGLLGDEGYLMHTLPVKTGALITSKGIIATIAILGSIIVGTVSILMIVFSFDPESLRVTVEGIGDAIAAEPLVILYAFEGLIAFLLSVLAGVYQIYVSLAIGQLANRHRILISLGAYIGIGFVMSLFGTILGVLAPITGLDRFISEVIYNMDQYLMIQLIFIGLILVSAIPLVIFHIVTEKLLSRRLNLL